MLNSYHAGLHFSITLFLIEILSLLPLPVAAAPAGCTGGMATICGASIPLPDISPIGNSASVHIPQTVLGDAYAANPNLSFVAECISDINGAPTYRTIDIDKISCAPFPCQTSTVRLCEASIPVRGGTPLGQVIHIDMPASSGKGNFTVQCVGSGGNPPVYQITDHSGVTCTTPQVAP